MSTRAAIEMSLLALLIHASAAFPATIRVPADEPTIQAGVDAAAVGDTVLIAAGTYTGAGNRDIDFGGQDIVLRSEDGPDVTIIDVDGIGTDRRGFVFASGETSDSRIEGLTITRGGNDTGGGAACINGSSPTFVDCAFVDCSSSDGGGVYALGASPTFFDCAFLDNGLGLGSGVFLNDAQSSFSNCRFEGNGGDSGGGAWVAHGVVEFTDCQFDNNVVGALGDVWGGGISASTSTITIDRCAFTRNRAFGAKVGDEGWGGAVYLENCNALVRDCGLDDNSADLGGGIYVDGGSVEITGCVLMHNQASEGGALACVAGGMSNVNACTLVENQALSGSGAYVEAGSSMLLGNVIIAFGGDSEAVTCDSDGATFTCSDVFGNAGGDWIGCIAGQQGIDGNISDDPVFCNPDSGDYTIRSDSPCAPDNSEGCGLIGALPIMCNVTALEPTTWGGIKAAFR